MTKGIENIAFLCVIWIASTAAVMDISMEVTYRHLADIPHGIAVSYFCSYCYLLSRQLLNVIYVVLIFVQTDSVYRLKKTAYKVFLLLPVTVAVLFIFSNFFTHKIFSITWEETYKRGPQMAFLYIYSIIYTIFGVFYLGTMRKYMGNIRWFAMISTYIAAIGAAVFQFLHPGYLIEMISTAFALLLVHLILYRSEETYNMDTDLYNSLAFEKQLNSLTYSKRNATIFLINFTNAQESRNYFGDEKFYDFIKATAERIHTIIGSFNGYKLYYHSSGSLQIIFNQNDVNIEKKYPQLLNMWKNFHKDEYESILAPKLCILEFLKDFTNVKNTVQFTHFFPKYMKSGQLLLKAKDIIQSETFKIQENISEIITRGLKNNRFEMFYQPIFNVKEKRYTSAEALIRLHDEQFGFLSPSLFIPAAEHTGLILPIGNYVLDRVFEFVTTKELKKLGLHYIELNLSVEQLLQKDLVAKVDSLQKKYGTPSDRINLEITESMAGIYSKTSVNNVEMLLKKHFSFSLDDYGTGYSNIKRAIDLPLSLVKIDKSIVDIVETPTGETIVRNTITMMHDVGFKIVCEGVESENQYKILEKLDCDYIQGFYFAKPLNQNDFIEFLREHNT